MAVRGGVLCGENGISDCTGVPPRTPRSGYRSRSRANPLRKNYDLICGEWIAVDGNKFRAVASIDTARQRFQLQRYLDSMEKVDIEEHPEFDSTGVPGGTGKVEEPS
jgi:hypothetical protein